MFFYKYNFGQAASSLDYQTYGHRFRLAPVVVVWCISPTPPQLPPLPTQYLLGGRTKEGGPRGMTPQGSPFSNRTGLEASQQTALTPLRANLEGSWPSTHSPPFPAEMTGPISAAS